jgi:hypothetical protein
MNVSGHGGANMNVSRNVHVSGGGVNMNVSRGVNMNVQHQVQTPSVGL